MTAVQLVNARGEHAICASGHDGLLSLPCSSSHIAASRAAETRSLTLRCSRTCRTQPQSLAHNEMPVESGARMVQWRRVHNNCGVHQRGHAAVRRRSHAFVAHLSAKSVLSCSRLARRASSADFSTSAMRLAFCRMSARSARTRFSSGVLTAVQIQTAIHRSTHRSYHVNFACDATPAHVDAYCAKTRSSSCRAEVLCSRRTSHPASESCSRAARPSPNVSARASSCMSYLVSGSAKLYGCSRGDSHADRLG